MWYMIIGSAKIPLALFKGENSRFAYCIPPKASEAWADTVLLPLEKGAGGICAEPIIMYHIEMLP